jgi:hypothetical protein
MYSANKSHICSLGGREWFAARPDNSTLYSEDSIAIKWNAMGPMDPLGRAVKRNIFPLAGN